MARPVKHTVDYFSHDADASRRKTLTILFNNFGHEGISFWWQLLENIANTDYHIINLRNSVDLEFLAGIMHFQPERFKEILKKVAELNAIDGDLYSEGTIWCQNLVDRLNDVYDNRKQDLPTKPELLGIKTELLPPIMPLTSVVSTQSKLKETKVKETKVNNNGFVLPEFIKQDIWDAFVEMRIKQKANPTQRAKELLVKDLEKVKNKGDDPNLVLEQSIKNGWKGLFPLKDGNHKTGGKEWNPRG